MKFQIEKDPGVIPHILTQILDGCVNGITLSDPDLEDNPIVFANEVFEKITGYSCDDIIGKNCRFLQGKDHDQPEIEILREAIRNRRAVEVTLKNYKKNGDLFYNRLSVTPLFDNEGRLIYFLGVQYDITEQIHAQHEIERLNNSFDLRRSDYLSQQSKRGTVKR
ncbi:PAS domain-containing protein [Methylotuvimicrobium sp.]|jgi:PAS domain S-box-containing protein|uniref:PAS domain-containing protein n=1 Tax=Methylotuvimicrobium sp. TaxID=2822413 RepID=UPI003D6481EC